MHRRLLPVVHEFTYPVHFFEVDTDSLDSLQTSSRLFRHNRAGIVSLHDADYLEPGGQSLRDKFLHVLNRPDMESNIETIRLVTSPKTFGYVFNPVSFFLALDHDGALVAAVAEVNNTFGDRHVYRLDSLERDKTVSGPGEVWRARADKEFHVSPFNPVKGEYRFRFMLGPGVISVDVDLYEERKLKMQTNISGRTAPYSDKLLARILFRHPVRTALTMPRIIGQAARLKFRKKLPVFTRPEPTSADTLVCRPPSWIQLLAMRSVLAMLGRIESGGLRVCLPDGSQRVFGTGEGAPRLRVHRYRFFTRIIAGGAVAFGESFTDGDISCDDLTAVLECLIRNRSCMSDGRSWVSRLTAARDRLAHLLNANTPRRSRKNIHAHYDLSNRFFSTWLDRTMTYSSGLYRTPGDSLEQAQINKLNALIDQARIQPGHHVLEIGSGWGSFAIQAAKRTGCRVTTVTISEEQFELARKRVREAGLEDRVDVQFRDYRTITGCYDRIVSIEMIEAVGHRYLPVFFEKCNEVLAEDGLLVLQAITIPENRYEAYRRRCDWIQKYIFPGGHLPSLQALLLAMGRGTPFYVEQLQNIGLHYARTLKDWREAFLEQSHALEAQGYDDSFMAKWLYYLAYCEAGFSTGSLNTLHLVISRPNNPALLRAPTNPLKSVPSPADEPVGTVRESLQPRRGARHLSRLG